MILRSRNANSRLAKRMKENHEGKRKITKCSFKFNKRPTFSNEHLNKFLGVSKSSEDEKE